MPDGSQISAELKSQLDLIEPVSPQLYELEALAPEGSALGSGRAGVSLRSIEKRLIRARADTESLRKVLDTLYEVAATSDASAQTLGEVADIILEKEQADRAAHQPGIDALERKLSVTPLRSAEAVSLFREVIDVANTRLALYHEHRAKLLKLMSDRSRGGSPRRAKPIRGDVDHEALTREFMARFPKLRAALAK